MERKIKKYRDKFKDEFKSIDINAISNYEDLLSEMEKLYNERIEGDINKLFLEKMKVEDKINLNKRKSIKDVVLVLIAIIYSVFVAVIGKLDVDDSLTAASWLLNITYVVAGILIFNLLSSYTIDKYSYGYNHICLRVLEKIEKKIEKSNTEFKIQNDLNDMKKFIGI